MKPDRHKARFVAQDDNEKVFIKEVPRAIRKAFHKCTIPITRSTRNIVQRVKIALGHDKKEKEGIQVNWKAMFKEGIVWLAEATVEGLLINYALHVVFGFPFSVFHSLAYGILVKEFVSIVWRVKETPNGTAKQILDDETNKF